MRSFGHMTLFHFRQMMRNKIAFFFNLIFPLILLLVFGSMSGATAPDKVSVGLADLDGGATSAGLANQITSIGAYEVTTGTLDSLEEELRDGKVSVILVIPEGTSAAVAAGAGPAPITLLFDGQREASTHAVSSLKPILDGFGTNPVVVTIPEAIQGKDSLKVLDYMVPNILIYKLTSAGLITVAIALATHRKQGTLRHMMSTPLSIRTWIGAQVVANLTLAVLQILVLYVVANIAYDVGLPQNLLGTAIMLWMGALMTLGIGMLVGTLAPNPDVAMPIGMILFMSLAFLGGAMIPVEVGPAVMQKLAQFVPTYHLNVALRGVMMQGFGLSELWQHISVVVAVAALTLGLATWRMRSQFVRV